MEETNLKLKPEDLKDYPKFSQNCILQDKRIANMERIIQRFDRLILGDEDLGTKSIVQRLQEIDKKLTSITEFVHHHKDNIEKIPEIEKSLLKLSTINSMLNKLYFTIGGLITGGLITFFIQAIIRHIS